MLAICKGLFTLPVPERNILSTLPLPLNEVQPSHFCQFFAELKSCCFFFSFSFFCLLKTLLGTEPSAVTPRAEFGGLRDTLSPHHPIWAWETETNIWYELKIYTRADGISGSRQQTERVQKTGQGMILPLQKILKS